MLTAGADATCANLIIKGMHGYFFLLPHIFLKTISHLENKLVRALIFTYRLHQNVGTLRSFSKTGCSLQFLDCMLLGACWGTGGVWWVLIIGEEI